MAVVACADSEPDRLKPEVADPCCADSRAGPSVSREAGSDNGGVDYDNEIRPLAQLLLDANTSLNLDGRGSVGLVAQEWASAARYAGERSGQGGSAVQGAASARAGIAEQARLIAAAKERGFFIGLGHPLLEALERYESVGGQEHDAYIVGEAPNQVVIRNAIDGGRGRASSRQAILPIDTDGLFTLTLLAAPWPFSVPCFGLICTHEACTPHD